MTNETVRSSDRLRSWFLAVLLGALVLASYWPSLYGKFLWDDQAHVTHPELRSWTGLGRIWTELGATQQYYPVLHTAFWIEQRIWGENPLGYHLVNVLLHATACGLLVRALRRLQAIGPSSPTETARTLPPGTEWLAAFLFAVHPVVVESVAWISEQKNTLSLVLYLLAALAYLNFHQTGAKRWYAAASLLFFLAVGTKTVTATLPAALLVVLWWRQGTLTWRRDVRALVPWFSLAAAAGALTAWVERTLIGAEGAAFVLTASERLLLAGRVLWFYLGKLAWPFDLMFIYPRWDVSAEARGWAGFLAGAVVLTLALWGLRRRTRGPLAGWLFFAGSLFPVLGFLNVYPFLFSYVADHFQYLASLGIIVLAAAAAGTWLAGIPGRWRGAGWLAIVALVAGFAKLTNRQARIYADAETLYRATIEANPECWMAYNNLALEMPATPEGLAESIGYLREALRLRPDYPEAHNNLGLHLTKQAGHQTEAMEHFRAALRLRPNFALAYGNLANCLVALDGRMPEALENYKRALEISPKAGALHVAYGSALVRVPGRQSEALGHFLEAVRLDPADADALLGLAMALESRPGREADAIVVYQRVLQLYPGRGSLHYHYANLLANRPGQGDEAIAEYREALRLEPGDAPTCNNLGVLLARRGEREESRKYLARAVALDPDYAEAQRNLRLLDQPAAE